MAVTDKPLRLGIHGPSSKLIQDGIDATIFDLDSDTDESCDIVLELAGASANRLTELDLMATSGVWVVRYGSLSCADAGQAARHAILTGARTVSAYLLRWKTEDRRFVIKRSSRLGCDRRSAEETGRRLEASMADLVGVWLRTRPDLNTFEDDEAGNMASDPRPYRMHLFASIRLILISVVTRATRLFFREDWAVGLMRQPITDFLKGGGVSDVQWLSQPDARSFLADPFGYRDGDRLTVLAERYHHRRRKGVIDAMTFDGGADRPRLTNAGPAHNVLEKDIHVSYPFVFEDEGEMFCIPETSRAQTVQLFRVDRPTGHLEHVRDLLSGIAVSDATLFRHEGRYWLAGISDGPRLYLWYADKLAGNWAPHAANPVKIDVCSARPAGTPFVHAGSLYRPAQDGSAGYGGAVVLNRVTHLSPSEFAEEAVMQLTPERDGPFPDGIHTLSAVGDWTLIDAKKMTLDVSQPFRRLCARLRSR